MAKISRLDAENAEVLELRKKFAGIEAKVRLYDA
jgi:hypothetical protein